MSVQALTEYLPLALIILFLVSVFAAVGTIQSPWFKGAIGESRVNSALKNRLDSEEYHVLRDLTLPTPDGGTTQVDHVVISRYGIFVIETIYMSGWIFGRADRARWTQVIYRFKSTFQNPIRQNFKHVKTVQRLLGIKSYQIHNIVVFVGSASLKTAMPSNVILGARTVAAYINSKRTVLLNDVGTQTLANRLSEHSLRPSRKTRKAHIRQVKARTSKRPSGGAEQCPRCGAELVTRINRRTGEQFLGCSRFPKCKGARSQS